MGLFGDLDVEAAADSAWPPNDKYHSVITDVSIKPSKKTENEPPADQKLFFLLTYTIQEGDWEGQELVERKWYPKNEEESSTADGKKATTYLKQRLRSLGVPEARMNDVDKDDLLGLHVVVQTRGNVDPNYPPNIQSVELYEEPEPTFNGTDDPWS